MKKIKQFVRKNSMTLAGGALVTAVLTGAETAQPGTQILMSAACGLASVATVRLIVLAYIREMEDLADETIERMKDKDVWLK